MGGMGYLSGTVPSATDGWDLERLLALHDEEKGKAIPGTQLLPSHLHPLDNHDPISTSCPSWHGHLMLRRLPASEGHNILSHPVPDTPVLTIYLSAHAVGAVLQWEMRDTDSDSTRLETEGTNLFRIGRHQQLFSCSILLGVANTQDTNIIVGISLLAAVPYFLNQQLLIVVIYVKDITYTFHTMKCVIIILQLCCKK